MCLYPAFSRTCWYCGAVSLQICSFEDTIESIGNVKGKLGVITSEPIENVEIEGFSLINEEEKFGQLTFSWWKQI